MTENELRKKFVDTAVSYVGVKQGSARHKSIVDTYNTIRPLPQGYKLQYNDAWCAGFASAMAQLCGIVDLIPVECSCPRMVTLAKKMGIWVENDAYVPKAGDLILYNWADNGIGDNTGNPDHVGVAVSVSNGKIKVIEGNKSKAVGYRELAVNGRYIRGFVAPKFASKATSSEDTTVSNSNTSSKGGVKVELSILKQGSKGEQVKALQALLVGYGYSIGASGVDGSFGPATLKAVKEFQTKEKIGIDGSVGPITWKHLLGVS